MYCSGSQLVEEVRQRREHVSGYGLIAYIQVGK